MPAGSRPGERRGGRKKGTKNVRTVAREAEASAVHEKAYELGITPLQVMSDNLAFYVAKGDRVMSQNIARDLAPFLHPKLSNIDVSARLDTRRLVEVKWTEEEREAAIEKDIAELEYAFREWEPPKTIEHQSSVEPVKLPDPLPSASPDETNKPTRDYARPGEMFAASLDDVVLRSRRRQSRRPSLRRGSSWTA
jgi:hypothetical protein